MNASLQTTAAARQTPAQPVVIDLAAARHIHRERDFGVGYGNSSGYATTRRYASNWAPPRFRFA